MYCIVLVPIQYCKFSISKLVCPISEETGRYWLRSLGPPPITIWHCMTLLNVNCSSPRSNTFFPDTPFLQRIFSSFCLFVPSLSD